MAAIRTAFDAGEHGFRFGNRFDLSLGFRLPLIGRRDLLRIAYGLCGGMCFAALDYYYANVPIPRHADVPRPGTPLRSYLWKRQLASLSPPVVPLKVVAWMLRDDEAVARVTATQEFPKVRRRIVRMHPTVLLLIRNRGVADPGENHQAVALGYDLDVSRGKVSLYLYDPNCPGKEQQLTMNLGDPSRGIEPQLSDGEPLRGFFVLDYRPRKRGLPLNVATTANG